jgi:hypothetical protein
MLLLYFHNKMNVAATIQRPSTWYVIQQKEAILNYTITVTLPKSFTCTSKRKQEDIILG